MRAGGRPVVEAAVRAAVCAAACGMLAAGSGGCAPITAQAFHVPVPVDVSPVARIGARPRPWPPAEAVPGKPGGPIDVEVVEEVMAAASQSQQGNVIVTETTTYRSVEGSNKLSANILLETGGTADRGVTLRGIPVGAYFWCVVTGLGYKTWAGARGRWDPEPVIEDTASPAVERTSPPPSPPVVRPAAPPPVKHVAPPPAVKGKAKGKPVKGFQAPIPRKSAPEKK